MQLALKLQLASFILVTEKCIKDSNMLNCNDSDNHAESSERPDGARYVGGLWSSERFFK